MWSIVLIYNYGKTQILENIIEDTKTVTKYKNIVENRTPFRWGW